MTATLTVMGNLNCCDLALKDRPPRAPPLRSQVRHPFSLALLERIIC